MAAEHEMENEGGTGTVTRTGKLGNLAGSQMAVRCSELSNFDL